MPANSIISLSPSAGKTATRGATVTPVVSTGRKQVTVPPTVGMSRGDAVSELEDAGFVVAVSTAVGRRSGRQGDRADTGRRQGARRIHRRHHGGVQAGQEQRLRVFLATFSSLRTRNYRLFFFGQMVSLCGTWMQTIALGWLVLQLSHNSAFAVGLVIALQFVPTLLFGVWGGVIADRWDKRLVLIGAEHHGDHRHRACLAHAHRRHRTVDDLRDRRGQRVRPDARQSGPALVRVGDGRASRPAQRHRAQQRHFPGRPHPRARARRCAHRHGGHRLLLPPERGVVRGGDRGTAGDAPRRARALGTGDAGEGPGARRPALRVGNTRAALDAAAHRHRRHARDQLPGGVTGPRQDHLRRERGDLQLDDDRDGYRRAGGRARGRLPRAGAATSC